MACYYCKETKNHVQFGFESYPGHRSTNCTNMANCWILLVLSYNPPLPCFTILLKRGRKYSKNGALAHLQQCNPLSSLYLHFDTLPLNLVWCSMFNMQCLLFNIQCPMFNVQCSDQNIFLKIPLLRNSFIFPSNKS